MTGGTIGGLVASILLIAVTLLDWHAYRRTSRDLKALRKYVIHVDKRVESLEQINRDIGLEEDPGIPPGGPPVLAVPVLAPRITREEAAENFRARDEEEERVRKLREKNPDIYPDSSL